ncbi:MBL fold metallo-hydrolase [Aspergillus vadensis CBS 113365]|uniref:Metallo-beta-lactamase domain-containing protein n=1 Tax=Aspergillus vadensis (strain CBS 113365 / IMI 142717 / IBT 24658) TaxID=1448311 RepID=A0A319BF78_ASPVC|nr:hypothetical protein BO88DRAFT_480093 [Aspergillus vadensis CBS 113365]PYH70759.1 hypothetical protein BO88DRAFT_480093 [Aspergillus vadensis CBS 113365]
MNSPLFYHTRVLLKTLHRHSHLSDPPSCLPPPWRDQICVVVHPIDGGQITLFLIAHPRAILPRYLLFDLGLRSRLERYLPAQQAPLTNHVAPYRLGRGVAQHLRDGGLDPDAVDTVILSHLHYDHHGDPGDFPQSRFIVRAGSLSLLHRGLEGTSVSHQAFDAELFRTVQSSGAVPLGPLPAALDLLGDGYVYVVDAPGHLPGHLNLLCRLGLHGWIYLGGDSCRDVRLLNPERGIVTREDKQSVCHCIHLDRTRVEYTLREASAREGAELEVVMAHDVQWWEKNLRFTWELAEPT